MLFLKVGESAIFPLLQKIATALKKSLLTPDLCSFFTSTCQVTSYFFQVQINETVEVNSEVTKKWLESDSSQSHMIFCLQLHDFYLPRNSSQDGTYVTKEWLSDLSPIWVKVTWLKFSLQLWLLPLRKFKSTYISVPVDLLPLLQSLHSQHQHTCHSLHWPTTETQGDMNHTSSGVTPMGSGWANPRAPGLRGHPQGALSL